MCSYAVRNGGKTANLSDKKNIHFGLILDYLNSPNLHFSNGITENVTKYTYYI